MVGSITEPCSNINGQINKSAIFMSVFKLVFLWKQERKL